MEDRFVEVVVDLLEDGDEAVVVDFAFLRGERFARSQFFEDVVDPGQGQVGVEFLLPLAVGVEPFPEVADALARGGA